MFEIEIEIEIVIPMIVASRAFAKKFTNVKVGTCKGNMREGHIGNLFTKVFVVGYARTHSIWSAKETSSCIPAF